VLFLVIMIWAIFAYPHVGGKQTLAVLPLMVEISDADAAVLGAGLTLSLIDRLSRVPRLRVRASAATPIDRGQLADLQTIGRSLNAETVLLGRLRTQGESLSLQFSLLKTADGARVWGEERRVKRAELELFQQELTVKIAFLLQLSLSEEGRMFLRALAASQSRNPDAYELYLRGRYYWSARNKENIQTAIDCFQQAIELDPTYALAHAGLADSYVLMSTVAYGHPMSTKEAMVRAKSAAKKALEIDDTLCEAHTSLGVYLLRYEWNWPEAEKEFTRAISLNPDYAWAHYWYSNLLALTGRSDKSIAESETARDLEPFSPHSDINLARALHFARQYDKAAGYLLKILEKYPNQLSALNVLGYIYQQQGRSKESIELFERLYAAEKLFGAAPLGYAYAKDGRKEDALKILDELESLSKQSAVPLFQEKAIIYFGLGDKDQAFSLLQESCKERFATFPFLLIEPFMESLRSDSRFSDLARCARLST
jgi:eukaryotic-like serine/threonine-protein kinase